MAAEITKTIFTSYKALSAEIIRVVDLYLLDMVSEADVKSAVNIWKNNASQYLLSPDGKTLAPTLVRYIGKRRAAVVTTVLHR